jgi:hypothetical protein
MQSTKDILTYSFLVLGIIVFVYGYWQNVAQSPLPTFYNSTEQGTFYGVNHLLSTLYATQFMIEGLFFIMIGTLIKIF